MSSREVDPDEIKRLAEKYGCTIKPQATRHELDLIAHYKPNGIQKRNRFLPQPETETKPKRRKMGKRMRRIEK